MTGYLQWREFVYLMDLFIWVTLSVTILLFNSVRPLFTPLTPEDPHRFTHFGVTLRQSLSPSLSVLGVLGAILDPVIVTSVLPVWFLHSGVFRTMSVPCLSLSDFDVASISPLLSFPIPVSPLPSSHPTPPPPSHPCVSRDIAKCSKFPLPLETPRRHRPWSVGRVE